MNTSRDVRRIAVFRTGGLGRMLSAVPALRSLQFGFPLAEITVIGSPWAESFVRQFAHYVDRFQAYVGHPGSGNAEGDPERTDRFLRRQRERGYDLAIQLDAGDPAANRLVPQLGAWVCAGYYCGTPPDDLDIAAPYPEGSDDVSVALGLMQLLGCPDYGSELEFPILVEDRRQAASLLRDLSQHRPLVGLSLGSQASEEHRRARFAIIAEELTRHFGAAIVLLSNAEERENLQPVAGSIDTCTLDLSGKTSLGGLGALVQCLDLLIGSDSGLAYLARAAGTPSISLGDDHVLPDGDAWGTHQQCSLSSSPEHVLRIAEQLLYVSDTAAREFALTPSTAMRPGPSGWAQPPWGGT